MVVSVHKYMELMRKHSECSKVGSQRLNFGLFTNVLEIDYFRPNKIIS
jgi:hypothetical protein